MPKTYKIHTKYTLRLFYICKRFNYLYFTAKWKWQQRIATICSILRKVERITNQNHIIHCLTFLLHYFGKTNPFLAY